MTEKEIDRKNKLCEKRLIEVASDPVLLKKNYNQLSRIEFNNLLVIVKYNDSNAIVSTFRHRGFNWKALNKLEKFGFLWMKRKGNSIIDYVVNQSIKERLIHYIEDNCIDVGVLETN